jgi:NAD(P)-dependent dehydrogenase (short-subunit alcohol dehydrogenase family)
MDLALTGKTVLITGGSKGIGLACAETFLAEGCTVILVSRDEARLTQARNTLNAHNRVTILAADLSQAAERQRVFNAHPDIDILINNAGAIPGGNLLDLSMETWETAWSLKVIGFIHLTKLYLEAMKPRASGIICNIIGSAGRNPRYDYICGATGNAALIAFTSAIGGKSTDWGIRVFGINPAATKTDRITTLAKTRAQDRFNDPNRWEETLTNLPLNRLIDPKEIAQAAAFLSSPACGYVSGTVLDVDGGGGFR